MGSSGYKYLPPPLDHHPDFPEVFFDPAGEPLLAGPQRLIDSTVFQIVPGPENPYIFRFGAGMFRNWETPDGAFDLVRAWFRGGREVVIHPRRDGVQAAGESRGYGRFVIGGGVSVFVAHEFGLLPDGVELGGVTLNRMVATFGVVFPNPEDRSATYHVIPAEYLVDPVLPGLPPGLSWYDLMYRLPPPPVFKRGRCTRDSPDFVHAVVEVAVSVEELDEGASTGSGDILRGRSYLLYRGLPPPSAV